MGSTCSLNITDTEFQFDFEGKYNISRKDLKWVEIRDLGTGFDAGFIDFKFGYENGYIREMRIVSNCIFVCFSPTLKDVKDIAERVRIACGEKGVEIIDVK